MKNIQLKVDWKYLIVFFCFMPFYKASAQGVLVFEKEHEELGIVTKGDLVKCSFSFFNLGEEAVKIENVIASCGCIEMEWPSEPIKSGQKGEVKIVVNTQDEAAGEFIKDLVIESNSAIPEQYLTLSGWVSKDQNSDQLYLSQIIEHHAKTSKMPIYINIEAKEKLNETEMLLGLTMVNNTWDVYHLDTIEVQKGMISWGDTVNLSLKSGEKLSFDIHYQKGKDDYIYDYIKIISEDHQQILKRIYLKN